MVPELNRRRLLSTAALAVVGTAAGCTQAQSTGGANGSPESTATDSPTDTPTDTPTRTEPPVEAVPDFDGWMDDVENYDYTVADRTDTDEVVVTVGATGNGGPFGFEPPVIQVEAGTTVRWKWTGNGGGHNIVADDGSFESGDIYTEMGVHFEHTFEEAGVHEYYCAPHHAIGQRGVVIVGDDYPTMPRSEVEDEATETPDTDHGGSTTEESAAAGRYDGYLAEAGTFDGHPADRTDTDEVVVTVGAQGNSGAFSFYPVAIQITPGTTVRWKWTGNGGAHNVVAEDDAFDSGEVQSEMGVHFEHTFEATGTHRYYCAPHKALGMKGVVEVAQ
jgi:halocyanin-like protein